jgi:cysteine synthase
LIGNTPLIELNLSLFSQFKDIRIFAKLEMYNLGGSIKDRPSLYMIEEAESAGLLKNGKEILEPTSGNTGIGMAWIGRLKGYKVNLVIPDSMSRERIDIMRSYGAKVILTPGVEGIDGAIYKAQSLLKNYPKKYVMLDQYNNEANWKAHYETTGPEIWQQTNQKIDCFISGFGTGGTITGVGRFLRARIPELKIIGVQPSENSFIPGIKNMQAVKEIPSIFHPEELDGIVTVTEEEALSMTKLIASETSLLVGPSSGASIAGVYKYLLSGDLCSKGNIVTIFPDGGQKYLSKGIFWEGTKN